VLRWKTPHREIPGGGVVRAQPSESGEWEVWVDHQPDLMIRVAIDAESDGP